jgi:hypothetical protein
VKLVISAVVVVCGGGEGVRMGGDAHVSMPALRERGGGGELTCEYACSPRGGGGKNFRMQASSMSHPV